MVYFYCAFLTLNVGLSHTGGNQGTHGTLKL